MVNIENIFSSVQNEINDIEMVRIQPGEYQDMMNQVMNKIAQETDMFLGRYSVIPRPLSTSAKTNAVVIPEVDPLTNNVLNPFKLERVLRQNEGLTKWMETREYSTQTIASTYSGNRSHQGMSNIVDRGGFATQFANPANNNLVDGSLTIFFTKDFEIGEQVVIDFIQEVPFVITKWRDTPSLAIPEFMREAAEALLLEKVCKRLFNKGDESFGNKYQMSIQDSTRKLADLKTYTLNFRDKRSPIQIKPSAWLPESRSYL